MIWNHTSGIWMAAGWMIALNSHFTERVKSGKKNGKAGRYLAASSSGLEPKREGRVRPGVGGD
ncbi:MAG: hypothetical protein JWM21_3608 [Acidobacteria bacterium]|nr:hypothetical protein [Acidobacteriota bacterium]